MIDLKFKRLRTAAILPTKSHDTDAGFDLYATRDFNIKPGCVTCVGLGIAWECPPGWCAQIVARSGLARYGVTVLGGLIDAEYRGEWAVLLSSVNTPLTLTAGDRIAQFVLHAVPAARIVEVDTLGETERGIGGFGSTGH